MSDCKSTSAPIVASNAFYCHDFPANEGNFVFGSLFAL
jgi:hypothetical protein